MTTIPYNPTEIAALRKEVNLFGIHINQKQSWSLLRLVGNRHLCVDALLMNPRPAWLGEMVGPIEKQ